MNRQKLNALKTAYEKVFDEAGETRLCGRDACANLIALIKEYTSADVGDVKSGQMNREVLKEEYHKLIGWW